MTFPFSLPHELWPGVGARPVYTGGLMGEAGAGDDTVVMMAQAMLDKVFKRCIIIGIGPESSVNIHTNVQNSRHVAAILRAAAKLEEASIEEEGSKTLEHGGRGDRLPGL